MRNPLPLKPPRVGCFSVRTALLAFALIGIVGSPCLLVYCSDTLPTTYAGCAFGWLLHFILLFGVLKNNEIAMNLTISLLIIVLILDFFLFLIVPIVTGSLVSSDYVKFMYPEPPYKIMKNCIEKSREQVSEMLRTKAETKFWNGLKMAADSGTKIALHFAVVVMEYTLSKRYWKYVSLMRAQEHAMEMDGISIYEEHYL
ncbi:hypothetical protein CAEBREN_14076 [Caenorhabditis brenneri]|uniref:Uncharacterized protein n=1 Tax=Caenorhabditis brenneri TaxID=135651 RepID=G0PLF2_CAEBE|nr:hypothetical protein CAEBREN_14076 [Caenorhabditis brenneri]